MKIHLQSDTHVERGAAIGPSVASDVAICAGDIGQINDPHGLHKYFSMMKDSAEHVIWVLGNHEFYSHDYTQAMDEANDFAARNGIILLDEALGTENYELDGVKFWGSTLWTDLKGGDWFVVKKIGHGMADFSVITDGDKPFTARQTMEINARTREKINWDADIIITHHNPVIMKHRRFPLDDITYGFCNDGLEQQILDCKAKYWIYGHTHDCTYMDFNGTTLVSNQQGYLYNQWQTGERVYEGTGFDPGLIIEI